MDVRAPMDDRDPRALKVLQRVMLLCVTVKITPFHNVPTVINFYGKGIPCCTLSEMVTPMDKTSVMRDHA